MSATDNTDQVPNNNGDIEVNPNFTAIMGTIGGTVAVLIVMGIIALILTIVGTVKMSKLAKPTQGMTVLVVMSWILALLLPVPVVNIAVPSALIHMTRRA